MSNNYKFETLQLHVGQESLDPATDVKPLVIHPASTTHSQMTEEELIFADIKPNTGRLAY